MNTKSAPNCDLAIEAHEMLASAQDITMPIPGIKAEESEHHGFISITRVKVENQEGSAAIGKPIGNYITIEMPSRFYGQQKIYEEMCLCCGKELKKITKGLLNSDNDCVLAAGLGNAKITADSLGPKTVEKLMITRHLKKYIPEEIDEGVRPLCAVSPGVLGTTGIETEEIIHSLTDSIKPKLVIVIDALCSAGLERINTTIQITDTGITPGAGVENKRKTINSQTLGVPVIAIGVPTVASAAGLAKIGIETAFNNIEHNKNNTESYYQPRHTKYDLNKDFNNKINQATQNAIEERFGNLIVTPKDVDNITDDIAAVIANGINIAVHPGITLNDIDKYV